LFSTYTYATFVPWICVPILKLKEIINMNKIAAEKIASEYYGAGIQLAMQKIALDLGDIQGAMENQRDLFHGSVEDRIGSTVEQRRREGALAGTLGGGLVGMGSGAMLGKNKGKALQALLAALGLGTGAVSGNLLGRASGIAGGGIEGTLSSLPGVMQSADFLSQPLSDY
jgi:hypothetical protein